ncbi:hypothetical protein MIR68_011924 [Amoeboaphelidium protococcarum]|nr:hypothetical protein MIR68_011924 [Amoeboaphelidium protococcarum]
MRMTQLNQDNDQQKKDYAELKAENAQLKKDDAQMRRDVQKIADDVSDIKAIASGNATNFMTGMQGWAQIALGVMGVYYLVQRDINDHQANLKNMEQLQRSYDDLFQSTEDD